MRIRGIVRKADSRGGFIDCPAAGVVRFDRGALRGKSTRRLLGRRVELTLTRAGDGALTATDVVVLPVPYNAAKLYCACGLVVTLFCATAFASASGAFGWVALTFGVNVATAVIMWLDKRMSYLDWSSAATWQLPWIGARAPESLLLALAACGASPMLYLSVFYFRHKLYKAQFAQRFQTIVAIQLLLLTAQVLFTAFRYVQSIF